MKPFNIVVINVAYVKKPKEEKFIFEFQVICGLECNGFTDHFRSGKLQ